MQKAGVIEFDDLPMDVFDVIDNGMQVESLTAGHGITEIGASNCGSRCNNSCSFCCCDQSC